MNEEIKLLETENNQLQKKIRSNYDRIEQIRAKCNHTYEHTYTFGDGDYEYTCSLCGDKYVR